MQLCLDHIRDMLVLDTFFVFAVCGVVGHSTGSKPYIAEELLDEIKCIAQFYHILHQKSSDRQTVPLVFTNFKKLRR